MILLRSLLNSVRPLLYSVASELLNVLDMKVRSGFAKSTSHVFFRGTAKYVAILRTVFDHVTGDVRIIIVTRGRCVKDKRGFPVSDFLQSERWRHYFPMYDYSEYRSIFNNIDLWIYICSESDEYP